MQNIHHNSLNHLTSLVTLVCLAIQTQFWRPTLLLVRKPKGLKCVKSITFLMTSISLLTIDTISLFDVTLLTVIKQQWNKQKIWSPYWKWLVKEHNTIWFTSVITLALSLSALQLLHTLNNTNLYIFVALISSMPTVTSTLIMAFLILNLKGKANQE